jgi:hypothetical protein
MSPLRVTTSAGKDVQTSSADQVDDAAPLAERYEQVFTVLRRQQTLVEAGERNGAEALRRVLLAAADLSRTPSEFMQLTQATFVENSWISRAPVVGGVIPSTTLPQPAREQFKGLPSTGWETRYKDMTDGTVNDDDQCHHLVAYMALGYYHGAAAAIAGSYYHKYEQGQMRKNIGDINLGILGGKFGVGLGRSTIRGPRRGDHAVDNDSLRQAVNRLCDELTDAGWSGTASGPWRSSAAIIESGVG